MTSATTDVHDATERVPFSTRVRTATAAAHGGAEHSPFMAALLEGRLDRDGAAELTAQLYVVYSALEAAADGLRDDPVAGRFVTDALTRVPSLEADLAVLRGADWRDTLTVLPATQAYVDRLREIASWPGGFVAHHYTRYLGDLSGGRVIGRRLAEVLGATDGRGVSFYTFADIENPKVFKDEYRARLDAVPWDDEERARVVDEVLTAYRLNTAVLADLGRTLPQR